MTEPTTAPDVTFHCPSYSDEPIQVVKMEGVEGLSQLYRFELLLQVDHDNGLEGAGFDKLIGSHVYIALDADGTHKIHGILSELETLPYSDPSPVLYRAVLVPRVWRLTQRVGSWVYQGLKISAILRGILTEAGFADDDFEITLANDPQPDYVVQYQEPDFQFVSRWMESLGIYYFFEQTDAREKLVIADTNDRMHNLTSDGTLEYDPSPSDADTPHRVVAISRLQRRVPKTIKLRDYRWSTPGTPAEATATADAAATETDGLVYFGALIDDVTIATTAQRRAEEIACTREVFECRSRIRGIAPGRAFTLTQHPVDQYDKRMVITTMEHFAVQIPPQLAGAPQYAPRTGFASLPSASVPYGNRFTTIKSVHPFRPARVTPRPRIYGTTLGRIDGATSVGMHAPTDEFGRYKVVMFYDQAPDTGGLASCWIRVAQRTSGPGYGDATRLHVGTEVLVTYLDGDPDRPVIVGALPNAFNASPVTRVNGSQDVVRTRAGGEMVFEDDADEQLPVTATPPSGAPAHVTS